MINIKENVKNEKEFMYMFDRVGWGAHSREISQIALDNTFYSVSIYEDDKIIGYGRLVGDSICYLYVQDIMVVPEYQGHKIGTMIMNKLIEKAEEVKNNNPSLRVYTGASKDKEPFYEKFGFVKRTDAGLGYGMILKNS